MRHLGLAGWMRTPEPPFWTTGEAHALDVSVRATRIV
jgi:hypothetical protein